MSGNSWSDWVDCEACGGHGCFSCDNQGGRHEDVAECDYCQGTDLAEVIYQPPEGMCSDCAREAA